MPTPEPSSPFSEANVPAAGATPSVDGVTPVQTAPVPPAAASAGQPSPEDVRRKKRLLILTGSVFYGAYVLWCFILIAILPSTDPDVTQLVGLGVLSMVAGAGVFVLVGLYLLKHIMSSEVSIAMRQRGLIRLAVLIPGILLSAGVPFLIMQQPAYPIDTIPADSQEFVAPLPITLSAARADAILRKLGRRPVQYMWYMDVAQKVTDTTVVPEATLVFQRSGMYNVGVKVMMDDGSSTNISKRIIVQQEVFSVTPMQPIVEQPTRFSVASLLSDAKLLKEVQWDFDGDGKADEVAKVPDVVHTFYATGKTTVSVTVSLTNSTQKSYTRTIDVQETPPLPFPLTLRTEPKNLLGPSPFGVLFTVETQEPLKEITWIFGDGKQDRGADLKRVGHQYDSPGIYSAVMQARSGSGVLAEVTTIVRVTDTLTLQDLQFEGKPQPRSGVVSGEVPLNVQLTPKTAVPLIQFSWETPEDADTQVTGTMFSGIYRREGTYTIALIAQGPDGKTLRVPLKIDVKPPAAEPTIVMRPESGTAPLRVEFDASETFIPPGETVAGFRWIFGDEKDGEEGELGGLRVEHTYARAGEFQVKLTIVTAAGKEYTATRTVLVRRPLLSACVTSSRVTLPAGGAVRFASSCSTGNPAKTLWDVRLREDPDTILAQSTMSTLVHVFDEPGSYVVTLTLEDATGYEDGKSVTITVTEPEGDTPPSDEVPAE